MGYPYFHLWRLKAAGRPLPFAAFPKGTPTLFIHGAKKRAQFHSDAFLARLEATRGSRAVRYERSAHWVMHEEPARFNADVRAFVAEGEYML
jgi:pimeloyl-ACP methyl ester carboxylesterase